MAMLQCWSHISHALPAGSIVCPTRLHLALPLHAHRGKVCRLPLMSMLYIFMADMMSKTNTHLRRNIVRRAYNVSEDLTRLVEDRKPKIRRLQRRIFSLV